MHLFFFAYGNVADSLKLGIRTTFFFFDPRAECLSYDWFFLISFFDPRNDSAIQHLTASRKSFSPEQQDRAHINTQQ